MNARQERFLADELFSRVLQATFQRSLTYEEKASDERKAAFKEALRERLEALAEIYKAKKPQQIPSDDHIRNIENLANSLSESFADCLVGGRFRIGSAQKALNLHLKYLWCLGEVAEPPHCPFDSIIIKKLGRENELNWTALDDIGIYRKLVNLAEDFAKRRGLTIAEWELDEYNRAQPSCPL